MQVGPNKNVEKDIYGRSYILIVIHSFFVLSQHYLSADLISLDRYMQYRVLDADSPQLSPFHSC